ncbi:hypothetical protein WN944_003615 [Citrus x changshan-huyou]|uniref:Uncharacterized protein n=1 Tax=Citrus x changshan-huyou TaxID=2935761 RepID=A0AAP0M1Y3_9ROSI
MIILVLLIKSLIRGAACNRISGKVAILLLLLGLQGVAGLKFGQVLPIFVSNLVPGGNLSGYGCGLKEASHFLYLATARPSSTHCPRQYAIDM